MASGKCLPSAGYPAGSPEKAMIALAAGRLRASVANWPRAGEWLLSALLLLAFVTVAVPLGLGAGFLGWEWHTPADKLPLLALRALFTPALLEETIFRVLPNPHPHESCSRAGVARRAFLSLAAYVLVHPLVALLLPELRPVFQHPVFLLLVALLGAVCLFAYRLSGSLWPPVAIHWLVVTGWLSLGGRGPLPSIG
jgi:predicted Abi (CAAX) family protease